VSRPLPSGFVGLSLEYPALPAYTGSDPAAINPLFIRWIRGLAPGQAPVVRIGGNSSDQTWWPLPGVTPPAKVSYELTPAWLSAARALAIGAGARLILGINMAAGDPAIAAAEARALEAGIGRQHIEALEIGNEGDLYGRKPGYRQGEPSPILVRPAWYDLSLFAAEFARFRRALAPAPVAGPAFAWLQWMGGLGRFVAAEPGLALVTFHRYPLHGCNYPPSSPLYPTIPHLLSDYSTAGLAQPIAGYAAIAHAYGLGFRVDELNSVACAGKTGVSDTFASALWALATLFDLARAGADGVNLHTFPGAGYELFTFRQVGGRWQGSARPEYYGLQLFAQAAPPGSLMLTTTPAAGPVKAWATRAPDGTVRVVLINADLHGGQTVEIAGSGLSATATLERLLAPAASATRGVILTRPRFAIAPTRRYAVTLPPASAALLTLYSSLTSAPGLR
jgi:hypothetical protein